MSAVESMQEVQESTRDFFLSVSLEIFAIITAIFFHYLWTQRQQQARNAAPNNTNKSSRVPSREISQQSDNKDFTPSSAPTREDSRKKHRQIYSNKDGSAAGEVRRAVERMEVIAGYAGRRMFHKAIEAYRGFVEDDLDIHVTQGVLRIQTRLLASKNGNPALDFYVTILVAAVRSHQISYIPTILEHMRIRSHIARTYTFYESLLRIAAAAKQYSLALSFANEMVFDKLQVRPFTLSHFVHFSAELGDWNKAWGFFLQLVEHKAVTGAALQVVLKLFARSGDKNRAREAIVLVLQQEKNGYAVVVDGVSRNMALGAFCAANDLDGALAFLEELDTIKKIPWDCVTYNVLLKGYARSGFRCLDEIAKFRQQMKVQGVKPNGFTYNLIVEAAVRGRNPQLAFQMVDEMRSDGIAPDRFTCGYLAKAVPQSCNNKLLLKCADLIMEVLGQNNPQAHELILYLYRSSCRWSDAQTTNALKKLCKRFDSDVARRQLPTRKGLKAEGSDASTADLLKESSTGTTTSSLDIDLLSENTRPLLF